MPITALMACQNSITKLSLHNNTLIYRSQHLEQDPMISCFPINYKPSLTHLMTTRSNTGCVKWKKQPMIPYATHGPAGTPSGGSWKSWVFGLLITFVVPAITTKGGLIKVLFRRVDQLTEAAEYITEVVEEVADKVDKVVEGMEEKLPEGSQIRKTLDFIENVAETVEKGADTADHFIDKVQEMEDKLEESMAPVLEEAKALDRETQEKEKMKKLWKW